MTLLQKTPRITSTKQLATLSALACVMLTMHSARAEEPFVNPDWANSAWYLGAGVGRSRASIDTPRVISSLQANGAGVTNFSADRRDTGYKLFVGKQMNRYLALELGYFDLGHSSFNATTTGNGVLNGETGVRGGNLDVLAQLPLSDRLSLLGRVGVQYARASSHFSGNRLAALTAPDHVERDFNAKAGVGLEYKLSEALALRGEVERYRVNDGIGKRGNVDLLSLNLVYKLGRPATAAPVYMPAPAPTPVAAVEPAPAPPPVVAPVPPAPQPTSEKVSFAAAALFGFDQAAIKPEGKAALDGLLAKLQGSELEVMVTVGHTDSVGSAVYNQKLAQRRAEAVKAYLVSQGVEAARIYTEGKGEDQPMADNCTAEGRAQNRRVTVEVVATRRIQPQ